MVVLRCCGIPLHKHTLEIRSKLCVRHKVRVLEEGVCIGLRRGYRCFNAVRGSHEQAGHVGESKATKFLEIFGTAGSAGQTVPSAAGLASYTESARSAMSATLQ